MFWFVVVFAVQFAATSSLFTFRGGVVLIVVVFVIRKIDLVPSDCCTVQLGLVHKIYDCLVHAIISCACDAKCGVS
jgi:hypothetical protein